MKELSTGFSTAITMPRPRGARLIEGFSLKLQRRIQFFDHATFGVWIDLEADPSVLSLCERPARLGQTKTDPVLDFWVRRVGSDEFLLLTTGEPQARLPAHFKEIPLREIKPVDRAASSVWTSNWRRMLPVIAVARAEISKAQMKVVSRCVQRPISLAALERQLTNGDPVIARATIFDMLRTSQLVAPSLRTQPLSLFTILEPAP